MKPASAKLPRGLDVRKIRRREAPPRNLSELKPGEKPWDRWPSDYHDSWYFEVRKKGLPVVKRSTETGDYREAVRRARAFFDVAAAAKWDKLVQGAELLRSGRRQTCTLGAIFTAYLNGPAFTTQRTRVVQTCRLLVAIAKGWQAPGSGTQITGKSDLAAKIDALPAEDVLTRETVREYFRICQGGTYQPSLRSRDHININKRLNFARQLFTARTLSLSYDGVPLPDLDGFLKFPFLPASRPDLEEEMIAPEAYTAMLDAADALESSGDPLRAELGLVNRMLRELGLRSGELLAARGHWLVQDDRTGRWYLDVRDREDYQMKGVEPGKLPVSDALLTVLLPRRAAHPDGYLIYPHAPFPTDREDLCRRDHNVWLKEIIGTIRSRKGNHRLRRYVATMIAEQHSVSMASQYLRHASEVVSLRNYIARRKERLPVVDDTALRTWAAPAQS